MSGDVCPDKYLFCCVDSGFIVAGVWGRSFARIAGSNPTGAWISLCCERCVLSAKDLCNKPINLPEDVLYV